MRLSVWNSLNYFKYSKNFPFPLSLIKYTSGKSKYKVKTPWHRAPKKRREKLCDLFAHVIERVSLFWCRSSKKHSHTHKYTCNMYNQMKCVCVFFFHSISGIFVWIVIYWWLANKWAKFVFIRPLYLSSGLYKQISIYCTDQT